MKQVSDTSGLDFRKTTLATGGITGGQGRLLRLVGGGGLCGWLASLTGTRGVGPQRRSALRCARGPGGCRDGGSCCRRQARLRRGKGKRWASAQATDPWGPPPAPRASLHRTAPLPFARRARACGFVFTNRRFKTSVEEVAAAVGETAELFGGGACRWDGVPASRDKTGTNELLLTDEQSLVSGGGVSECRCRED